MELVIRIKNKITKSKITILSFLQNGVWKFFRFLLLFGFSFIILYPLIIKVTTSLMTEQDLIDTTVNWIPYHASIYTIYNNYKEVIEIMEYPSSLLNSFVLSFLVGGAQLITCTIVGYGFARFDFRFKKILFALVIFTLLVPPQMIMIPLFLNFRFFNVFGMFGENGINLLGTYWPFVLTAITGMGFRNGLFIYIARQHFRGMPRSLEESAYVDGAGQLKTFYTIMLPEAVPILIVIFLFSFVWQWNDIVLTSLYLREEEALMPFALRRITNYHRAWLYGTEYITIINNIGMILFLLPLIILFIPLQRYFIESVARTGIVG